MKYDKGLKMAALILGQAIPCFVIVILSHVHGWSYLTSFTIILLIRSACDALVWEAVPVGMVRYSSYGNIGRQLFPVVGYFFSGHTAFSLLFACTITKYISSNRRLIIAILCFLMALFVILVQLITRSHYFVDIIGGASVSLSAWLAVDRWVYPLLDTREQLSKPLNDQVGEHHEAYPSREWLNDEPSLSSVGGSPVVPTVSLDERHPIPDIHSITSGIGGTSNDGASTLPHDIYSTPSSAPYHHSTYHTDSVSYPSNNDSYRYDGETPSAPQLDRIV
jgi:membrane-associated phospholipid phosphatase